MPRLGTLYKAMEPKIRRLPKRRELSYADVIKPAFRLERAGGLEIYYAPMDWLRPTARLAVIGITPDKDTMRLAFQTVVNGLADGRRPSRVADDAMAAAPFSGFRPLLIEWLDYLGVGRHLDLASASVAFSPSGGLVAAVAGTTGTLAWKVIVPSASALTCDAVICADGAGTFVEEIENTATEP